MNKLLEVKNLKTYFYTEDGTARAVDGIDFSIYAGKTFAIAGESGCGKSITAFSLLRLVPNPGKIIEGEIIFEGKNILSMKEEDVRNLRGRQISMIFQNPFTSLNPVFTIGEQIGEAIKIHNHKGLSKEEVFRRVVHSLEIVEMPSPENYFYYYPHQLSGGMQQRVMIAMALSSDPKLLIADEPTTALDLTIQAQILDLLKRIQKKLNMGIIIITHNLGIIQEIADDVAIMYLGRIVERTSRESLFAMPLHPYTIGLLNAVPKVAKEQRSLYVIPGNIPSSLDMPSGCKFHPRCEMKIDRCINEEPCLEEVSEGHFSRCWRAKELRS